MLHRALFTLSAISRRFSAVTFSAILRPPAMLLEGGRLRFAIDDSFAASVLYEMPARFDPSALLCY